MQYASEPAASSGMSREDAQAVNAAAALRGVRMPFDGNALVSVIVPTRDRCELLARAIRSVLTQTYANLELLIVDDGSADGTVEMVSSIKDSRVRWMPNPRRGGAGYSRYRGAEAARGDFIAFLDSDDWWLADKLRLQLAAAELEGPENLVMLCPPACDDGLGVVPLEQPILRYGQPIADYVYAGRQATVLSSGLLLDGRLGRRVRFDPGLRVNQDTDYLLRLEREGARFHCQPQPLYVLDTRRRTDRMSYDPSLCSESRRWYERMRHDWSRQAQRGYFLWDLSVRYASTGRRLQGFLYFLRGLSLEAGSYRVLRQLLRVIGGGEVPTGLKLLRRQWLRALPMPRRVPNRIDPILAEKPAAAPPS